MKILHVSTFPVGGAFTGAYRLHKALLKKGVQSKMLVSSPPVDSRLSEVYFYNKAFRKTNIFNRVSSKLGFPVTANQKKNHYLNGLKGDYEIISFPFSDIDITKSEEFKNADIIHLHWIAEYLDYVTFFKKCLKPVVFTLRDLNPMQGIFHYEDDKIRNARFYEIEQKCIDIKISAIKKFKNQLLLVGISKWITGKSKQSKIFKNLEHHVIPNCINVEDYLLFTKVEARQKLNIPKESIVFSFVSNNTKNKRKGLEILKEAFLKIDQMGEIILLTVWKGDQVKFPLFLNHKHFGHCNHSELITIYAASDALIFPSLEEALGNVMLEAMACGTPVIGTPVGGLLDVIKPGLNGLLSKDVSAEGLKQTLIEFLSARDQFNPIEIRKYIEQNFNEDLIAGKYIELYKSMLH